MLKIGNGKPDFMAVAVKRIYEVDFGSVYSVTHYYELNGDLMCDPDVEFLKVVHESDALYFPLTFRRDSMAINQRAMVFENIDGKTMSSCNHKVQADLVSFCNQWMCSIKSQQGTWRVS